jgi:catechol 2,3-dioxygenase-like lactoylglutathione lyase family enzyme
MPPEVVPSPPPPQSLVLYAKDKARVSAFYCATLGLKAEEEQPSHDLLVGDGIELVIHAIPPQYSADIVITTPPALREDTPLKPSFVVPDLAAVRLAARRTGGGLNGQEQAWTYRGTTVLDGFDPEGNVLQFRQVAAG